MTRLQKRVQQIGRIVEFINTVADRSDLLALSAELVKHLAHRPRLLIGDNPVQCRRFRRLDGLK